MKSEFDECEKSSMDNIFNANSEQDFSVKDIGTDFTFKHKIVWTNVIGYILLHTICLIGLYMIFTLKIHIITTIYTMIFIFIGMIGVTMGAHRYFTHHTFKATPIMHCILILIYTINGQNSLWSWVRNHRMHHKYSDTDGDPHNARRGFFFSHTGWYLSRKNPKILQYGKSIDMSDLNADYWVMFQRKFFTQIYIVLVILIPCIIPIVLWNEDPVKSFMICFGARTCIVLNVTSLVNSISHTYGTKPYDNSIRPVENPIVSFLTVGEGWHNFHHVFPSDYRTSEFGMPYNVTAYVIDFCAKIGWIYDLKVATDESIRKRVIKSGDKSHKNIRKFL